MSNHDISPKVKYGEHDCLKKNATLQEYSKSLWTPSNPDRKKKKSSPNRRNPPNPPSTFHPNHPTKSGKIHIQRKSSDAVGRSPFSCSPGRWSPNSDEAFVPPFPASKILEKLMERQVSYFFRQLYPPKPATIALKKRALGVPG